MNNTERNTSDQHMITDWPIEMQNVNDIPKDYQEKVLTALNDNIFDYVLIFAPACLMVKESFDYLFAYGNNRIFYFYKEKNIIKQIIVERNNIFEIIMRKELLDAEMIIKYDQGELVLPYVSSSYYLYDPFLNWIIGLKKDFLPSLVERDNPRPRSLYHDSLTMFNYSLAAYRLGNKFKKYDYSFQKLRKKWMPWKSSIEEWLDVKMEKGTFHIHSFEYLTECTYKLLVVENK